MKLNIYLMRSVLCQGEINLTNPANLANRRIANGGDAFF